MKEVPKKYRLFHPEYSNVDYTSATQTIIEHAVKRQSFGVSALAVHGLVTSLTDHELNELINKIDLIVPDGQPIRWALNSFYNLGMKDRVYGPELTLHVLKAANERRLSVYLYGSKLSTLKKFSDFIKLNYRDLKICGLHEDRFREATNKEDILDIKKINESGANIVLVGRGCPRQEKWVANHKGRINAAMLAVGAAFDFHAGTVKQAPKWMQNNGLEWFFRLLQEPKRLAKRYFVTNTRFIFEFLMHKLIYRSPFRLK